MLFELLTWADKSCGCCNLCVCVGVCGVYLVCVFGVCVCGMCVWYVCVFGVRCVWYVCVFGLCVFGVCVFGVCACDCVCGMCVCLVCVCRCVCVCVCVWCVCVSHFLKNCRSTKFRKVLEMVSALSSYFGPLYGANLTKDTDRTHGRKFYCV